MYWVVLPVLWYIASSNGCLLLLYTIVNEFLLFFLSLSVIENFLKIKTKTKITVDFWKKVLYINIVGVVPFQPKGVRNVAFKKRYKIKAKEITEYDLSAYKRNPIVLQNHDFTSEPVGKVVSIVGDLVTIIFTKKFVEENKELIEEKPLSFLSDKSKKLLAAFLGDK